MESIGLAVVGLGCRGSSLLNTLAAIPQARVVAVCDRYPDRTASAAAAFSTMSPYRLY